MAVGSRTDFADELELVLDVLLDLLAHFGLMEIILLPIRACSEIG